MKYGKNRIKLFHIVEYLGGCLDANLSGEPMATKFLKKIDRKLQFLYRQNELEHAKLRIFLCKFFI